MLIKICGITRPEDARAAAACGATAIGLVFWPRSPRAVDRAAAAEIVAALPSSVMPVGVFVDAPMAELNETAEAVGLGAVQLHGDETAVAARAVTWPIFRSATLQTAGRVRAYWPPETVLLLDAHDPERRGGTGVTVDWGGAARLAVAGRMILAGGLAPDNVAKAIARVRPWGVDVSSGVEASPGRKDQDWMARFVDAARRAFQGAGTT